jgi:hypothetical protein
MLIFILIFILLFVFYAIVSDRKFREPRLLRCLSSTMINIIVFIFIFLFLSGFIAFNAYYNTLWLISCGVIYVLFSTLLIKRILSFNYQIIAAANIVAYFALALFTIISLKK